MQVIGDRREAPVLSQRVENERSGVDVTGGVRESTVGGCLGWGRQPSRGEHGDQRESGSRILSPQRLQQAAHATAQDVRGYSSVVVPSLDDDQLGSQPCNVQLAEFATDRPGISGPGLDIASAGDAADDGSPTELSGECVGPPIGGVAGTYPSGKGTPHDDH
jgi:hypothetical protein